LYVLSYIYRYYSEDELDQPSEGPVRQSQGADLAEWLDQFPPQDPLFHARQRVNLHQEVGLPPAELDTFQGLSFDLKGLAECLSRLPLHEVLKLPPSIVENGNTRVFAAEENPTEIEKHSDADDIATLPRRDSNSTSEGEKTVVEQTVGTQPPLPPPMMISAPTSKQPSSSLKVTDKLQEMNIHATEDDLDDELDALLGLREAAKVEKHSGPASFTGQGSKPGKEEDSLEAWLDTL
jgi:hypothetical protein